MEATAGRATMTPPTTLHTQLATHQAACRPRETPPTGAERPGMLCDGAIRLADRSVVRGDDGDNKHDLDDE
jgi:hypothetical protein